MHLIGYDHWDIQANSGNNNTASNHTRGLLSEYDVSFEREGNQNGSFNRDSGQNPRLYLYAGNVEKCPQLTTNVRVKVEAYLVDTPVGKRAS